MAKKTKLIKSPLRYPGGKSRAISTILKYLPPNFSEYREPFVGGGSLFIYLKQKYPNLPIWINDLNPELYLFWKIAQTNLSELVTAIYQIKETSTDGKKLFTELAQIETNKLSDLERAIRFFVLNRITFSGTIESGGFSQASFLKRFTYSSIERLEKLRDILKDVKITNLDYREVLNAEGKQVLIFLDPPYLSATESRLYGKDGNLHTSFNHQRFAEDIKQCPHQCLITYDDSLEIRKNFSEFNLFEWTLQYGMNNYKQGSANKGQELMITNYPLIPHTKAMSNIQQLSLNLF